MFRYTRGYLLAWVSMGLENYYQLIDEKNHYIDESRKFKVLGTQGFDSKYRKLEL